MVILGDRIAEPRNCIAETLVGRFVLGFLWRTHAGASLTHAPVGRTWIELLDRLPNALRTMRSRDPNADVVHVVLLKETTV